MGPGPFDHLYAETRWWDASVAFWEGLGFAFVEQWGDQGHRAGRLERDGAAVVLAEVPRDADPTFEVFFRAAGLDAWNPGPGVEVLEPPTGTHWGTRRMRVRDPDGRVYSLEDDQGGG